MNKSPANKLTLNAVRLEFESAGCTLLAENYVNLKTGMYFTCRCGSTGFKSLDKFRNYSFCKDCGAKAVGDKNGRLTLGDAQAVFAKAGHTLLATEYVNNSKSMPYLCKCGTSHEMSLGNMHKGKQCPTCTGKTVWSLQKASELFQSSGCELLESEYTNSNQAMRFRCTCGSESATSLGNFLKGVRCMDCGTKKISGANNYLYDATKTDEERTVRRTYPGYQAWRRSVFARDAYTCQVCSSVGGSLNAHHLNDYATHKDQRTVLANGVTLCEGCHDDFHDQYGRRNSTTEDQFIAFKGNKNG